jgi:hypothetical protein
MDRMNEMDGRENPPMTNVNRQASIDYCEAIVNQTQWTRYTGDQGRVISRERWLEETRRVLVSEMEPGRCLDPASLYLTRKTRRARA